MIATLIAEQASAEGATAGAQRLIFDELAGTADLIEVLRDRPPGGRAARR